MLEFSGRATSPNVNARASEIRVPKVKQVRNSVLSLTPSSFTCIFSLVAVIGML